MVRENKVNNVNHLYYDEQNNEILYLDHVFLINLNLYLYMVNVVEMIEKEYPKMDRNLILYNTKIIFT
jgi:hypothetical protein